MHILILTSELVPFSTTGDLGELVGTLARALRDAGARVTVLTPFYAGIDGDRFGLARRISKVTVPLGDGQQASVGLFDGKFPGSDVRVVFVDDPPSFARPGLYGENGTPYADNHRRFDLLCRSAPCIALELGIEPDVVHAFDWQTGLALLLRRDAPAESAMGRAKTVFTILDASFAGLFDRSAIQELGLSDALYTPEGIEFHGQISLLKAGVLGADVVCVPSPSYARELVTEEQGAGLHGLFQSIGERLHGVLPGIDHSTWNPSTDHRIARRYDVDDPEGKADCKNALQQELGLPTRAQVPLVAALGPCTASSGFDLVSGTLPHLAGGGPPLQLAVVGATGDDAERLREAGKAAPELTLAQHAGTDPDMLHRVLAGADALLLPALHAPSAHLALKGLRYGAIPVAHRIGGLNDTVVDFDPVSGTGTGILFNHPEPDSLAGALGRLARLHAGPEAWRALSDNAMRQRFDMELMARRHLEIYEGLLA